MSGPAAFAFINTGATWRPYAPVFLGGSRNGAGDITLTWTRRTRLGGAWLDGTDALLGESSESYAVRIYADGTYASLVNFYSSTAPAYVYTETDQVADFGSLQSTVYWDVAQIGTLGAGTEARGVT